MTRRTALLVVALVAAHLLLHVGFGLGRIVPDLSLLGLLIASRRLAVGTAAGVGFCLGLLEDAFSVLSFGANALALTVVGIVGSRSKDVFLGDSRLFLVTYFGLASWLREVLAWTVSSPTTRPDFVSTILIQAPLSALYLSVVGVLAVLAGASVMAGEAE